MWEVSALDGLGQESGRGQRAVQSHPRHTHPLEGRAQGTGFFREGSQREVNAAKTEAVSVLQQIGNRDQFSGVGLHRCNQSLSSIVNRLCLRKGLHR